MPPYPQQYPLLYFSKYRGIARGGIVVLSRKMKTPLKEALCSLMEIGSVSDSNRDVVSSEP